MPVRLIDSVHPERDDGEMSLATWAPIPTLLFAAFSTLAVAGCGVSISLGDGATTRTETRTVDAEGVDEIVVGTADGAVSVRGDSAARIEIVATMEESRSGAASFSVSNHDDRVTVDGDCESRAWQVCHVGFEISVPRGLDVRVETDNGAVTVDRIAGDVDVESDNGAIVGDDLSGDVVRARSDNGRIEIGFDEPPVEVDAETDNGAIVLRVPGAAYDVDADSENGTIDVGITRAPDAERTIRARTGNGAICVERT